MNRCTYLFAGLSVALFLGACNRPPTTPEAEPSVMPETPVPTTTPPSPAPSSDTSPSSLPPPSAPSTSDTPSSAPAPSGG